MKPYPDVLSLYTMKTASFVLALPSLAIAPFLAAGIWRP